MHHRLRILAAAALALALLIPLPARAQEGGGPPPALVETAEVVQRRVETKLTLAGTAEPHRLITLAAQVEGVAVKGEVEEGDRVEQGQVVLRLDDEKLAIRLDQARAQLAEAEALLAQAERDLNRKAALHKARSVPLKELEDAQSAVDAQRAAVRRWRQQVRLLQSDLADTRIRAPRSGVVISRLAYQGEWVTKGGPVLELNVLDPLKVVVPVPERHLPALRVGQEVPLTADALPGRRFTGRIAAIIPSGDVKSRTFPVQIRLENPEMEIKPGMLVRATLEVGQPHQALLIPKDALVISQTGYSVFLVADGAARPVQVELGSAYGGMVEIKGELSPGQQVVTTGNERLFPGQPVNIAPPGGSAGEPAEPSPDGGPAAGER
jgi:RND family efflux transporter MFP subunit